MILLSNLYSMILLIQIMLWLIIIILFIASLSNNIQAYLGDKKKKACRLAKARRNSKFILLSFIIKIALYQLEPFIQEALYRI